MSLPPAISVIMPVHNGATYLREALDSVFRQTFSDFELIVIDDCSTDESSCITKAFGDKRLKLIQASERLRISKALNLGIDHAQGTFIARMDADDICHPFRLERQFTFLKHHPQIGFCGTWVRRFGEGQHPYPYRSPAGFARFRAFSLFDNPIVHSSVMLRREVLARLDAYYRDDFVDAEDYDLWTRLLECTEGDNLPEVLLDYRVHAQSVTLQKKDSMDRTACRVLKRELTRLGLAFTNDDVLKHRRWSTGRLDLNCDSRNLECASQWLCRLLSANQTSHTFAPNAFLWAAREIWFALCYQALMAKIPCWKPFFSSPISRRDVKHTAILFGAMVKHAQ